MQEYPIIAQSLRDNENSLNSFVNIEELFITRKCGENSFYAFQNYEQCFAYIDALEEKNRIFHEIILGNKPQKLKFDIDASLEKMAVIAKNLDKDPAILMNDFFESIVVPSIVDEIYNVFTVLYSQYNLVSNDVVICTSSDETKYSAHIIINNYCVSNYEEARYFTSILQDTLDSDLICLLDLNVNKSLQNFRLVNCHKYMSSRTKKIISTGHVPADSIITNITNCVELCRLVLKKTRNNEELYGIISQEEIDHICKVVPALTTLSFKSIKNGIISFTRDEEGICPFCESGRHVLDPALKVKIHTDGTLMLFCVRYNVSNDTPKYICIREGTNKSHFNMNEFVEDVKSGPRLGLQNKFASLPADKCDIYTNSTLNHFPVVPTLVVRAPMKMGKTKRLREYIQHNFNEMSSIRVVSFRQTFSNNFMQVINNDLDDSSYLRFQLYSDITGPLSQSRLIVQVESLPRLVPTKVIDLLVLDECESIFEQLSSGLSPNHSMCFLIFVNLLKIAKHVVCLDANITDRTYNVLKLIRPNFEDGILYQCNLHKNASDSTVTIVEAKDTWMQFMSDHLKNDKKIVVPVNSLKIAKELLLSLQITYPKKKIILYSSETNPLEKKEHFAHVNNHWCNYDVVMYTPTVSAGVSFEVEHFDALFGYFTSLSCNVETCLQMMGRVRNLGDKQSYLYITKINTNLPETNDAIEQLLRTNNDHLFKDTVYLSPMYDENGMISYNKSDYFHVWMENTKIKHMSKNRFVSRFINYLVDIGVNIQSNDQSLVCKLPIEQAQEKLRKKIIVAPEIELEAVHEIYTKKTNQEHISEDEFNSLHKFKLRLDYNFQHEIDHTFLIAFDNQQSREQFANLCTVGYDHSAELAKCMHFEQMHHTNSSYSISSFAYYDLHYDYKYKKHETAIKWAAYFGWSSLYATNGVCINPMQQNDYTNFMNDIQYVEHLSSIKKINRNLQPIMIFKHVLVGLYGINLRKLKGKYFLVHEHGFSTNKKCVKNPIIVPIDYS